MRVALFFDGKNHMKALRRSADDRWLDHGKLADWTVEHVGGDHLFAAYYYTGVPTPQDEARDRHALSDLLDNLEKRTGFFVRRFNRRASTRECPHCDGIIAYTEEKMVDTSLVADVIMLAVRDAFDIAVIFSGDLDVAPALQAIHGMGKQGWVATFGDSGLSRTLSRSAWGTINLLEFLDEFSYANLSTATPVNLPAAPPEQTDDEVLRELRRAETHFSAGGGFVGAHYFIHRWKGHDIPDPPDLRREALQRLMQLGSVETYQVDGKTALRTADPSGLPVDDDETTVEMRLSDAVKRLRRRVGVHDKDAT